MIERNSGRDDVRRGGWIIAAFKSIAFYDLDDPVFDPYEAIVTAGKAAELLSAIRGLGIVDGRRYDRIRQLTRIKPSQGIRTVELLESIGAVNLEWETGSATATVRTIQVLQPDKTSVLRSTSDFYECCNPSGRANASLAILDLTANYPVRESNVIALVTKDGVPSEVASQALRDLVTFGLLERTRETEAEEPLIFNPRVFKSGVVDVHKALAALSSADQEKAFGILDHVRRNPGVPLPAGTKQSIVVLLTKVGLIDLSGIQVKGGAVAKEFPTSPAAWGIFSSIDGGAGLSQDLIDDSKLLLNSLRYGEHFSRPSRGQIFSPAVLIGALIDRGEVGPATAIGEDYPLPLVRGIVNIVQSRQYPSRYYMELRKRDVAEAVRDVLEQNVIVPQGDVPLESLERPSEFHSPEQLRAKRQLPKELIEARDQLVFTLRTHRRAR